MHRRKLKSNILFLFYKMKFHIYFCIVSGQFSVLWSGSCPSFRWRDLSPSPHFLLQKRSWCVKIAQISVQRNIRRDIWIICSLLFINFPWTSLNIYIVGLLFGRGWKVSNIELIFLITCNTTNKKIITVKPSCWVFIPGL